MRTFARRSLWLGLAAAVVIAVPAMTTAQIYDRSGQVVPPRDRPPIPTTGTGVIKGRVVDGVSGTAVARARVRLGGSSQRPSVLTDAAGVFAFKNLPPGVFALMVDKSTYMTGRYPESGQTLRSAGRPLVLEAGQSIDTITLAIFHGAAIAGHIIDASGDPIEFAEVRLLRLSGSGGKPSMRNSTQTNDLGEYRLGKLDPGNYLVMASGRRTGSEEPPLPNTEPPPQPVPSYYPGVTAVDQAQTIRVARGQTIGDVDITLVEDVPSVVSGTALGEDGQPLATGGFIMARATIKDMPFPVDTSGGSVRPDGTFRLTLAPGEYVLEARANSSGGADRMGILRVTVSGNLDGLSIQLGQAATASGRVIFEGSSPIPPNPQQMQFQLFSYDGMACRQGRMTMAADWTFTIDGLSGTCSAPAQTGMGAWLLKSVQINGQDLDDQPITFEPGQRLRNVQVVFTDRRAGVTFQVADDGGQTTRDYVALLFQVAKGQVQPSIRSLVPPPDEMIALMSAMSPSRPAPIAARRESIMGLRPGEYYAIAIDDIGSEDARDPAVVARLIPSATRVTIGDATDTPVALRRQKLADLLKR